YCAPQDIFNAIARLEAADDAIAPSHLGRAAWDILDIGCGTGLCGALFHSRARALVGVDLSANMIAIARQRNIYTQLITGGLLDTLRARSGAFDLILAGD